MRRACVHEHRPFPLHSGRERASVRIWLHNDTEGTSDVDTRSNLSSSPSQAFLSLPVCVCVINTHRFLRVPCSGLCFVISSRFNALSFFSFSQRKHKCFSYCCTFFNLVSLPAVHQQLIVLSQHIVHIYTLYRSLLHSIFVFGTHRNFPFFYFCFETFIVQKHYYSNTIFFVMSLHSPSLSFNTTSTHSTLTSTATSDFKMSSNDENNTTLVITLPTGDRSAAATAPAVLTASPLPGDRKSDKNKDDNNTTIVAITLPAIDRVSVAAPAAVEYVVGYSSNLKKRKQFFSKVEAAAQSWRGRIHSTTILVKLVAIDDYDDENDIKNAQLDAVVHKHTDDMIITLVSGLEHKHAQSYATTVRNVERLKRLCYRRHNNKRRQENEWNLMRGTSSSDSSTSIPTIITANTGTDTKTISTAAATSAALLEPIPVAIDHLDGVWKLLDRQQICKIVEDTTPQLSLNWALLRRAGSGVWRKKRYGRFASSGNWTGRGIGSNSPNAIGTGMSELQLRTSLQLQSDCNIKYPVIVKKRLACGTKCSHQMAIAYDEDGVVQACDELTEGGIMSNEDEDIDEALFLKDDMIVQECVANHGLTLFKVYAMGDRIVTQVRPSVDFTNKDIVIGIDKERNKGRDSTSKYYTFDSQLLNKTKKKTDHEKQQQHYDEVDYGNDLNSNESTVEKPPYHLVREAVKQLAMALDVSLLGLDMIYDVQRNRFFIIDVNYFPGYKGVADAHVLLLQHVIERVWLWKHQGEDPGGQGQVHRTGYQQISEKEEADAEEETASNSLF